MKKLKHISILLFFFPMACGETDKAPVEKPMKEQPVKEQHIMSGYMKALEKAEEVQEKTDEAVARQEKAIDDAVGNK